MSMDLRRRCADGRQSLADLLHWPTLIRVGGLAGFAVVGLIALAWTLTRPAGARPVVRQETAPVVETILASVAQPEQELLAFAKVESDLGDAMSGEKPAPAPTGEPQAASKKALGNARPARLDLQAVEVPPALADLQTEEAALGCGLHGTTIRFARSMTLATREAMEEDKLLLVMHISGHFEDPGFT